MSGSILALLLLFTNSGGDLVTLLNAEDYFRTRGIDMEVAKLLELAGKDPVDGKTQIQQLLALRVLGENAQKYKEHFQGDAAKRKLLDDVAAGIKAQDKQGFAREYASWAVLQLGGTVAPVAVEIPAPFKEYALAWFPAGVTHAGALNVVHVQRRTCQRKGDS